MLRLGVMGGSNEEPWRDVARRLRGAELDAGVPASDAVDALVMLAGESGAVERSLAAGKHVLLADETLLHGDRLDAWSALAPSGARLAVLNLDRFRPSRLLIRQQLERNLGEPGLVRVHRWATALSLADLARDLDAALNLMGRPPEVVHALRAGEALQVHLGFPGGGMALIAHAAGPAFGAGYSALSVIAANGAAYSDDHAEQQLSFKGGLRHAVRAGEDVLALTAMVQSFVDGLASGADFSRHLAEWRRVLAVRDAVLASLDRSQSVKLEGV